MRGYRVLLVVLLICFLTGTTFITSIVSAQNTDCLLNLPPLFVKGMRGKLSEEGRTSRTITIRRNFSSESSTIGFLRADDGFTAVGEIGCSERMYWQSIITDKGLTGFVAESDRTDYFIEPISLEIYRFGHGRSHGVSWSPDSKMIAIGSTLGVWLYTDKLEPVRLLPSYDDGVRAVAWSPDGKKIATANSDKTVQLWDVASGKSTTLLRHVDRGEGNEWWDGSITWSPDSTKFASAGLDGTVRIWNVKAEKQLTVLYHDGAVYSVVWHRDGKRLASGGQISSNNQKDSHGFIVVWDITSGKQNKSFKPNSGENFQSADYIEWIADSHKLVASIGGLSQSNVEWDTQSDRVELLFSPETGPNYKYSFRYSPNGKRKADLTNGSVWLAHDIVLSHGFEHDAKWSNDNKLIAVTYERGVVVVSDGIRQSEPMVDARILAEIADFSLRTDLRWSTVDGQPVVGVDNEVVNTVTQNVIASTQIPATTQHTETTTQQPDRLLATSPDSTQSVVLRPSESMMIYDRKLGGGVAFLVVDPQFGIKLAYSHNAIAAWSPDGNYVAVTDTVSNPVDYYLVVWDMKTAKTKFAIPVKHTSDSERFFNMVKPVWSSDSSRILLESPTTVVDLLGNTLLKPNVKTGLWLSDSNRILTNDPEKKLFQIHDVTSGTVRQTIHALSSQLTNNRRYGAFTGNDRAIQIWDLNKEQQLITLDGLTSPATIMAWQPNNKRLAVASEDHTIRIWDVATGKLVQTIGAHRMPIRSIVWKPDGTQLYSTSDDGTLRLWDVR